MDIKIGNCYKINTNPEIAFIILDETKHEYIVKLFFKEGDSKMRFEKKGLEKIISRGIIQEISKDEAFKLAL